MNWIDFKSRMFDLGCFSVNQVYAWQPGFDRNAFGRWVRKGYLVRLRQGFYAFPEYQGKPDMAVYFAARIYNPSYVSLHTALAFYGLIPEAVTQITSVTSLKTALFKNGFGEYSYKSVREDLMFGYAPQPLADSRAIPYATREKALLDLLYLYPFYNTATELADLRLDPDALHEAVSRSGLEADAARFRCAALERRLRLLMKVYGL